LDFSRLKTRTYDFKSNPRSLQNRNKVQKREADCLSEDLCLCALLMGECCPPGSIGEAASEGYIAKGEVRELKSEDGALKCSIYVSLPSEPDGKALLILHDIFGVDSGRTKEICDNFAAEGYVVVLPSLAKGKTLSDDHDPNALQGWRKVFALMGLPTTVSYIRQNTWANGVRAKLHGIVLPFMRNVLRVTSIGLVSFCWGAYPQMHLLSEDHDDIRCGVGFHPSFWVLTFAAGEDTKFLTTVNKPIFYMTACNDPSDVRSGGMIEEAMKKNNPEALEKSSFVTFKEMVHGWVNRGDLKVEKVQRDYKIAIDNARNFFKAHL